MIDIGAACIDRDNSMPPGYTVIAKENPANASGKITKVYIWAKVDMVNVEVAIFQQVSANTFTTRSSVFIGNVAKDDIREFDVDLDVVAGDYIGYYCPLLGEMERTLSGVGYWLLNADGIPCTDQVFSFTADRTISLYGAGVEPSVGAPKGQNMAAMGMMLFLGATAGAVGGDGGGDGYERASYDVEHSTAAHQVVSLELALGATELIGVDTYRWYRVKGKKYNEEEYTLWLKADRNPFDPDLRKQININRYILQEGAESPREYVDGATGTALLPKYKLIEELLPNGTVSDGQHFPNSGIYLGKNLTLTSLEYAPLFSLPDGIDILTLDTEVMIGQNANKFMPDNIDLTEAQYDALRAAGMNLFPVNETQESYVYDHNVFYYYRAGLRPDNIKWPDILYRSNFLGTQLFDDEPIRVQTLWAKGYPPFPSVIDLREAVHIVQSQTLQNYRSLKRKGLSVTQYATIRELAENDGIDLGTMQLPDLPEFIWEFCVSGGFYEMECGCKAIVSEYNGWSGVPALYITNWINPYFGTTLTADSQTLCKWWIPFLRGPARHFGGKWGVGVYRGCTDPDVCLETAHKAGAAIFMFWNSADGTGYDHDDILTMISDFKTYIAGEPARDMASLLVAATDLVVNPYGYDGEPPLLGGVFGNPEFAHSETNPGAGATIDAILSVSAQKIEELIDAEKTFDVVPSGDGVDGSGYTKVWWVKEDATIQEDGTAPDPDVRRNCTANYIEDEPTINGQLTEDCWTGDWSTSFVKVGSETPADQQTHFKVRWSADNLFIGIKCDEPSVANVKENIAANKDDLSTDDSVEIFIGVNNDVQYFYQFQVSSAGYKNSVIMDSFQSPSGNFVRWFSARIAIPVDDWEAAVYKDAGGNAWYVEIKIPFQLLLKNNPASGDILRLNVCRSRYSLTDDQSAIDIGSEAIDRATGPPSWSDFIYIPKANVANAAGVINRVKVYLTAAQRKVRIGTFIYVSQDDGTYTFENRDWADIGDLDAGLNTVYPNLLVEAGDYIGVSISQGGGKIDMDDLGEGYYSIENIPEPRKAIQPNYIFVADKTLSIYAEGLVTARETERSTWATLYSLFRNSKYVSDNSYFYVRFIEPQSFGVLEFS